MRVPTVTNRTRVLITGIGAVTTIGTGRAALWEGAMRNESVVRCLTRFDAAPFRSRVAGQIDDFDPLVYMDKRRENRLDRFAQFSLASSLLAVEDAHLTLTPQTCERTAIYIGSALGGIGYAETQHEKYVHEGIRAVNPALALSVFGGASSSNVAIELGITGPTVSNANGCASGAIAIGEAWRLLQDGHIDVVFAGGSEAPLYPLTFGSFSIIKAMSTRNDDPQHASRPFDAGRDGFVMGEGAAVLILETEAHAVARGAQIYGEVLGYATTNDAYHMTAPHPEGIHTARAMQQALATARLAPEQIDYINAHASSTPLNDATETKSIRDVFGDYAYRIPVSGTKGMTAHSLGASGAIEAALCALALTHRRIPGTTNLETPGPGCDLDYVPEGPREGDYRHILSNSFGFGGMNASLVFGRYDG
jgi:3-oxoacyl-[acyl-carrier-protein] synthase II